LILAVLLVCSSVALAQTAQIEVTKYFPDNTIAQVEVNIDCNTGILLSDSLLLDPGVPGAFVITDFTSGILTCSITETHFVGYGPSYDNGSVISSRECLFEDLVHGAKLKCTIVNLPNAAMINVTKVYSDGSSSPVDVALDCNTGIELDGTKMVTPGLPVTFEVSEFISGELNCRVTEAAPPGYRPTYNNGTETSSSECQFNSLEIGDEVNCTITNTPHAELIFETGFE
jgi:hypothetical protein